MSTATATAATPTVIPAGNWVVDASHSQFGFSVKHMGIANVRGEFKEFEGQLEVPGDGLAGATLVGKVAVASVYTAEDKRDEHLRTSDFFAADEFPEMSFRSTQIEVLDDQSFRVTGELTLREVTNEIVFHADVQGTDLDPWGKERVGVEITGLLSRSDYGMTFNQALGSGNMLVGDKVKLAIDISAVKA
ncbi:MAG TPA: YceI family protein [Thermoleophilaceae bacterium]|nr:YceI family protein [Thermoleophilaceae bacterium]